MPQQKFNSLTGEKATQQKLDGQQGWSTQQADKTNNQMQVWQKKTGVSAFTTYQQYQAARATTDDEAGIVPPWHSLDLTSFIAKDVQTAINQIKDVADKVIAYANLVAAVAKTLASIAAATISIIETAINLLRDEIKSALDQLLGLGGAYILFIPPDWQNRGGIDHFKKTFYDSLNDRLDLRRPQIANTTEAHALFLIAGAPDITQYSSSASAVLTGPHLLA